MLFIVIEIERAETNKIITFNSTIMVLHNIKTLYSTIGVAKITGDTGVLCRERNQFVSPGTGMHKTKYNVIIY